MSKTISRVYRYAIAFIIGLTLSACAVSHQAPSPSLSSPAPPSVPTEQKSRQTLSRPPSSSPSSPTPSSASRVRVKKSAETLPRQANSPRALASLRLTEHGRMLLDSGKTDDAIATLERAVNVNPSNGQNYYYLSEAWLRKENHSQAKEFNRLAAMYLRDKPEWTSRVNDQKERIRAP